MVKNIQNLFTFFKRDPGIKISTDESKIILEIMGDIDIIIIFCSESCGTGKPENLTILFKQKNNPKENKLVCNKDNNYGGVKFKNNYIYTNIYNRQ